ncbi:hypothetical protein C8J56DRAFT_1169831 [Mycena floridula]|nr:hypothetical protein C8J56DRAFT_1169831 [Mycena floridula]
MLLATILFALMAVLALANPPRKRLSVRSTSSNVLPPEIQGLTNAQRMALSLPLKPPATRSFDPARRTMPSGSPHPSSSM